MKTTKKRAQHRIKIIQGQLKKIEEMIEKDRYCVDIMIQSLAVQKSLSSLNKLILENHLRTCVVDQIKSGKEKKALNELANLYHLENKG